MGKVFDVGFSVLLSVPFKKIVPPVLNGRRIKTARKNNAAALAAAETAFAPAPEYRPAGRLSADGACFARRGSETRKQAGKALFRFLVKPMPYREGGAEGFEVLEKSPVKRVFFEKQAGYFYRPPRPGSGGKEARRLGEFFMVSAGRNQDDRRSRVNCLKSGQAVMGDKQIVIRQTLAQAGNCFKRAKAPRRTGA